MGGRPHEFFKVYLSSFSSRKLCLPPAFVQMWKGKVPDNCTVKEPTGKLWPLQLKSSGEDLHFAVGWQEFVSHHRLVDGDFLLFHYDGSSQFEVTIFGKNSLKKTNYGGTPPSTHGTPLCKDERCGNRLLRRNPTLEENPTKEQLTNQGRCLFLRSGKLVLRSSRPYTPQKPHFSAYISRENRKFLKIPEQWLLRNKVQFVPKIRLINDEGKVWKAFVETILGSPCIARGWGYFLEANKAEYGDMCVLELIRSKDGKTRSLRVHIDRENRHSLDA